MLHRERTTFGQQVYNGQKPTFFTNNVMQLTYDLSRYRIPDGQIVLGGVYNFDTWAPAGPNALSLATLSYYQTFLNKLVELKFGYLANAVEFWGPFLAGNLAASIFGPSSTIPVELGINAWAWATPAINIKVNGPGIQRASSPDGPSVEKIDNPTGLKWSTPNSGVLAINELAEQTLLQQVILNLVKNTIEAMAAGPTDKKTLRLVTTQDANSVVSLSVQDSGPGITPENQSHVFDPFLRRNRPGRDWDFPSLRRSSRTTAVNCGSPRPVQMAVLLKSLCQV
jgi:hypothetical protein